MKLVALVVVLLALVIAMPVTGLASARASGAVGNGEVRAPAVQEAGGAQAPPESGLLNSAPGSPVPLAVPPQLDSRPIRLLQQANFIVNQPAARKYNDYLGVPNKQNVYGIQTSGTATSSMAQGAWNQDKRDDLYELLGKTVTVTLSASTPASPGAPGTKYTLYTYTSRYQSPHQVVSGDWDGNGYADAFVIVQNAKSPNPYQIDLYRSSGGSPSGSVMLYLGTDVIYSAAADDFNRDGRADLALVTYASGGGYTLKIVLSGATSSCVTCKMYGAYLAPIPGTPTGVAMGDWDRDGYPDALVAYTDASSVTHFSVLFGLKGIPSTPQTVTLAQITTSSFGAMLASGDWNADGRDDLFYVKTKPWEIWVTYSASTGAGDTTPGSSQKVMSFAYQIMSLSVGDWTGNSVYAAFDGVMGDRTVKVPVALLMPPPFESGYSDPTTGYSVYGTGTEHGIGFTGSATISAGFGVSVGVDAKTCFIVCFGAEAKFEVEVSASLTFQVGYETRQLVEITYEMTADRFYNTETGQYEPIVVLARIPYDDYRFTVSNPLNIPQIVQQFVINVLSQDQERYGYETAYLSNWNNYVDAVAHDLPKFTSTRVWGDLRSYMPDTDYTNGNNFHTQPILAQYATSGDAKLTLTSEEFFGVGAEVKVEERGEISAAAGATVAFIETASLALGVMATIKYTSSIDVGGRAPLLNDGTQDTNPALGDVQYEIYGYRYMAYAKKWDVNYGGRYPQLSLLVLDWKTLDLHEGYPAVIAYTASTGRTVTVGWAHSGGDDRRTAYYVEWSEDPAFGSFSRSEALWPLEVVHTIRGLIPETQYFVRVRATYESPKNIQSVSSIASVTTAAPYPPTLTIDASPKRGSATLTVWFTNAIQEGKPPFTYSWTFGDGGTSSIAAPSHSYVTQGTYTASLTITDSAVPAQHATASISIEVGPPFVVSPTPPSASGDAPFTVTLHANPTGGFPGYTCSWSFGDQSWGTGCDISHQYVNPGSFVATVDVTDSIGQYRSGSVPVTVNTPPGSYTLTLTYDPLLSSVKLNDVLKSPGSYSYPSGTEVKAEEFDANPDCYSFMYWTGTGGGNSPSNPIYVLMTASKSLGVRLYHNPDPICDSHASSLAASSSLVPAGTANDLVTRVISDRWPATLAAPTLKWDSRAGAVPWVCMEELGSQGALRREHAQVRLSTEEIPALGGESS